LSPPAQRAKARVGTVLDGKWHLDALLGVGGTAAVYAATHRNGKRGAVKVLHPELSVVPDLVARFAREGYVANKIAHPGAVSVIDDDRAEDGSVYLVMELLTGQTLEALRSKPMPLEQVLDIGDQLLGVLAAAHAQGIVHRDIKPANLFMTNEGRLKVLDFGIARLAEPAAEIATQTGTTIGTPAFMPPEQARGRWSQVDARTDVWAVGATLLSLLAGKRPRKADTPNEELLLAMTQPLPPALTLAPHLPVPVARVLDRAVAFEQDDRFPDAETMRSALRDAHDSLEGTMLLREPVAPTAAPAATAAPAPTPPYAPPIAAPPPMMRGQTPSASPASPASWPTAEPALTTGRGLCATSQATRTRSAVTPVLVVLGLGVALVVTVGVAMVKRGQGATSAAGGGAEAPTASAATATTATATAPAAPSATTIAPATGTTTPTPAASATVAVTASTGAAATSASHDAGKRPVTRARPGASAKSDDPFDQRF
jgi:serine/threonine-protein kinase